MTLKKTLFVIALLMALLLPAGEIIRHQNPWSCFNFTFDESFFAQAANNWVEGNGYRMYDGKPFDPLITSGIVLAWGARFFQIFTQGDLLYSGRIFIYACFLLLLCLIAFASYRREKNWLAIPLSLGIFAYGLSKIPQAGYFAFGFLGEAPALVAAALAFRFLDRRKYFRAGVASMAVFLIKPTYIFFPIAAGLVTFLRSPREVAYSILGMLGIGSLHTYMVLLARKESLAEYLGYLFTVSNQIARNNSSSAGFLDYYRDSGPVPAALSIAILALGAFQLLRFRKNLWNAQLAAFFPLVIGILFYVIIEKKPVTKQWSAILALSLVGFAIHWGSVIASKFAGWIPREQLRAVTLSVIATFVFAVGQNAHHHYKRIPENSCPSKEQSSINREIRKLVDAGEVRKDNIGQLIENEPYSNFLYRIGWNVPYLSSWSKLKGPPPRWITGESRLLFPAPAGCTAHWSGGTFSIVRCQEKRL